MRDKGLDKGLIRYFDDAPKANRGQGMGLFGFRKMFRDYLGKLNVVFYDSCCPAASDEGIWPVRYNGNLFRLERFNGTTWVDIAEVVETTSTTTTSTSTTTTTTLP